MVVLYAALVILKAAKTVLQRLKTTLSLNQTTHKSQVQLLRQISLWRSFTRATTVKEAR